MEISVIRYYWDEALGDANTSKKCGNIEEAIRLVYGPNDDEDADDGDGEIWDEVYVEVNGDKYVVVRA